MPGDPATVGPYRLVGRLGQGGMGQVYLARSPGGRLVAVKVIRPELAGEPGFRTRFAREVAAARNVSGMFTALVVDADTDGPVPWLATAYVAGPSLAEAVEEQGPLPPSSILALAAGLAEGLQAIHAVGVVHRDLKPSNVLLADDGPRVIDFGISRAREASMLTQTGTVMGSPGYLSPEQAEGYVVGPPSDIFSLGGVLTYAATGEGPFGTGPTPALMYRVVNRTAELSMVPAVVRPLVERCLAKDPANRPTPAELLTELDQLGAGVGVLTPSWLPLVVTETLARYVPTAQTPATPPQVPPTEGMPAPAVPTPAPRQSAAPAEVAAEVPAEVAAEVPAEVAAQVAAKAATDTEPPVTAPDPATPESLPAVEAEQPVAEPLTPAGVEVAAAVEPAVPAASALVAAESVPAELVAAEPTGVKLALAGLAAEQAAAEQAAVELAALSPAVTEPPAAEPVGVEPAAAEAGLHVPTQLVALAGGDSEPEPAGLAALGLATIPPVVGGPGVTGPVRPPDIPARPTGPGGPGGDGTPPPTDPARFRRRLVLAAAAALILIAGTAIAVSLAGGGHPSAGEPTPSVLTTSASTSASTSHSKTPTHPATSKAATHKPSPHPRRTTHSAPATTPGNTVQPTQGGGGGQTTPAPPPPTPTPTPTTYHPTPTPTPTTSKPVGPPPQQITGYGGGLQSYGCSSSASQPGGSAATVSVSNSSAATVYMAEYTTSGGLVGEGSVAPGGSGAIYTKTGYFVMVENAGYACLGVFGVNGSGSISVGP
jgi:hypothetical protein